MRRWTVVLVSPKEGGNVGAAARAIRNFGGGGLRVVDPRCEVNGGEARRFSSGAADLLRTAPVYTNLSDALEGMELSIGLTGYSGRHHRLDCVGLLPTRMLESRNHLRQCALVFGREERGMEGDELDLCDFLWSLPTNPDFPSLNLAQAIGVALSAVAEAERQLGIAGPVGIGIAPTEKSLNPLASLDREDHAPATTQDMILLGERIDTLMRETGWEDDTRVRSTVALVRNALVRGNATQRDVKALHGIFKHALGAVRRARGQ